MGKILKCRHYSRKVKRIPAGPWKPAWFGKNSGDTDCSFALTSTNFHYTDKLTMASFFFLWDTVRTKYNKKNVICPSLNLNLILLTVNIFSCKLSVKSYFCEEAYKSNTCSFLKDIRHTKKRDFSISQHKNTWIFSEVNRQEYSNGN